MKIFVKALGVAMLSLGAFSCSSDKSSDYTIKSSECTGDCYKYSFENRSIWIDNSTIGTNLPYDASDYAVLQAAFPGMFATKNHYIFTNGRLNEYKVAAFDQAGNPPAGDVIDLSGNSFIAKPAPGYIGSSSKIAYEGTGASAEKYILFKPGQFANDDPLIFEPARSIANYFIHMMVNPRPDLPSIARIEDDDGALLSGKYKIYWLANMTTPQPRNVVTCYVNKDARQSFCKLHIN